MLESVTKLPTTPNSHFFNCSRGVRPIRTRRVWASRLTNIESTKHCWRLRRAANPIKSRRILIHTTSTLLGASDQLSHSNWGRELGTSESPPNPSKALAMGESTKRSCGDVLLIPTAASGHLNPMMYVAKELLKRGVTMTMLLPEGELSLMKSHIDVRDNKSFCLELLPPVQNRGGPGAREGREGGPGGREGREGGPGAKEGRGPNGGGRGGGGGGKGTGGEFEFVCEPFLNRVLADQQAGGEGPRCMIADQFTGWARSWATKLHIPRYVCLASPTTFGYACYNLTANLENGLLERGEADPVMDLSGIPPVRLGDLPKGQHLNIDCADSFDGAEGLLINTFYDLEAPAIDAFRAQIKDKGLKVPKLLPIGPMLPSEFFTGDVYKGESRDSVCIKWLDARPKASVVYIAFGSTRGLSPPQTLELAKALEESQESFLWALQVKDKSVDVLTLLPPGFQERTKDRGLIFPGLAPQLQILSHPATGGFLTHCGWNSSLESISRGIPMIGWPQGAEQKLCCRVLVDQAGVATEIRPGLDGSADFVTSPEIVSALNVLMKQEEGQKLKKRVVEQQSHARAAVAPGGSSSESYKQLVETILSTPSRIVQK
ncbi:unnamed protein product [Calypogeia fissa]